MPVKVGFAQVGQTEKTSAFVVLSTAVRSEGISTISKRTNNQLFFLLSADGFGQTGVEYSTCAKPWP
jgi:hypothetical protein